MSDALNRVISSSMETYKELSEISESNQLRIEKRILDSYFKQLMVDNIQNKLVYDQHNFQSVISIDPEETLESFRELLFNLTNKPTVNGIVGIAPITAMKLDKYSVTIIKLAFNSILDDISSSTVKLKDMVFRSCERLLKYNKNVDRVNTNVQDIDQGKSTEPTERLQEIVLTITFNIGHEEEEELCM